MHEANALRLAARYIERLAGRGYEFQAVNDFTQIQRLMSEIGKPGQTPMFSISRLDLTRDDAFWLFLTKGGRPIGTAAAKIIRLEDESLDGYLRRTSKEQYEREDDPIEEIAVPVSGEFQGSLIYLGELFISERSRGCVRALEDFVWILKILATLKWREFDWIYAFIADEQIRLAPSYNFTRQIPNAIRWKSPTPDGRLSSHWLMANSKADWLHLCKIK